MKRKKPTGTGDVKRKRLEALIEDACVDAHDESEQAMGFYTWIEENVTFPFSAQVIGESVMVMSVDLDEEGEALEATCRRKGRDHRVALEEVVWEGEGPVGAEHIEAYKLWKTGKW
ncbi:MAG: hypothetical protein HKL79_02420 [Thermoplasmata archaeon]|nr:hypothetical protein [Thermoplasmata archaeon]